MTKQETRGNQSDSPESMYLICVLLIIVSVIAITVALIEPYPCLAAARLQGLAIYGWFFFGLLVASIGYICIKNRK